MAVIAVLSGTMTFAFLVLGIVGIAWHKRQNGGTMSRLSLTHATLMEGLRNQDPAILAQFLIMLGFAMFVAMLAITAGLTVVATADLFGWIFVAFGAFFAAGVNGILFFTNWK